MKTVVICSPVRRKPAILREFLQGLDELDHSGWKVKYYFVDDNDDEESSKLLRKFEEDHKDVFLQKTAEFMEKGAEFATRKDGLHVWNKELIERIARIKDAMLEYVKKIDADYAFLVDSDIVMSPNTISHLIKRGEDIVSEIFWTEWTTGVLYSPNAWLQDEISPFVNNEQKHYDEWEIKRFTTSFYNMLKVPGMYEVGGLGACTLIGRDAIEKGVSFELIENVTFWGEDRHLCIRAKALGLKLFVDTVYPAYHIYRDEMLAGVDDFKKNGFMMGGTFYNTKTGATSLIRKIMRRLGRSVSNIVHGASAWLKKVFRWMKHLVVDMRTISFAKKRVIKKEHKLRLAIYVNEGEERFLNGANKRLFLQVNDVVVVDATNSGKVAKICKDSLGGEVKYKIVKMDGVDAGELSRRQWDAATKGNLDWVLFLQGNETLGADFVKVLPELMKNDDVDIYSFRIDGCAKGGSPFDLETEYVPMMLRFQPKFNYRFARKQTDLKHDRLPRNAVERLTACDYPLCVKALTTDLSAEES